MRTIGVRYIHACSLAIFLLAFFIHSPLAFADSTTFTDQTAAGAREWFAITSSSDGTKLAAVVYGGYIYTSTDSGATWTEQTNSGSRNWISITSSSDGSKLAAVVNGGDIYTSTDSGATWTDRTAAGTGIWYSIASSADGSKLAAVIQGSGDIYTSTDSGATWTDQTAAGTRNWASITSSSDGSKLAAVDHGGYIYTSTDSGATWTAQTSAGSKNWNSITSSSDGAKLAVAINVGDIYTSTDSGATWTDQTAVAGAWYSITSSSDGSKLAAVIRAGDIYTVSAAYVPVATTQAASSIGETSVTGNGTITDQGFPSPTVRGFAYGTTAAYGATTTESGSFGTGAFTATISGLTCGTTYHYAAYAANSAGTSTEPDTTFTTSACPVVVATHHSGGGTTIQSQVQNLIAMGNIAAAESLKSQWPQLFNVSGKDVSSAISTSTAVRDLELGMTGSDVLLLQKLLNANGFILAEAGAGSPGNETTFFGSLTKNALAKYQAVHGVVPSIGYFGPITRPSMTRAGVSGRWW